MIKRILSLTVTLIMALCALPLTVVYSAQYANLYYEINADNTEIAITGCDMSATSVSIPSKIDGLPVTRIESGAFYFCNNLTQISLPDSITYIGEEAFENTAFYNNESNWENGVLYIGQYLIAADSETVSRVYSIKDGTKVIADAAFFYCSVLKEITIPNSVTNIGVGAFCYTGLTNIDIPSGVTSIEDDTFSLCAHLETVTIPNSVTSIGDNAFGDCYELSSIDIPNSVTNIGDNAFNNCGLISIDIPNSVTHIGKNAFFYCDSLQNITIGSGVTHIGREAFKNTAYYNDKNNWEDAVLYIGQYLIEADDRKIDVDDDYYIKDGTKVIADWAFESCFSYVRDINVHIPSSVKCIGENAFLNCRNMSINVASGNTNYSSDAGVLFNKDKTTLIMHKKGGEAYSIPNGVINIADNAFEGSLDLKLLTVPSTVTNISETAFGYFYAGLSIDVDPGNAHYSSYEGVLFNKDRTTLIAYRKGDEVYSIPKGTKIIGEYAFGHCLDLMGIAMPSSVTSIGNYAFWDCMELASVDIGSRVTSIGEYAFGGCENLETVTIPYSMESIGKEAFEECYNLTDIYYEGTEDDWYDNVRIYRPNNDLYSATMHYSVRIAPVVTNDNGKTDITIPSDQLSGNNISSGSVVMVVLYDSDRPIEALREVYNGNDVVFETDKTASEAVALFWDSFGNMQPLHKPVPIELSL